MERAAISEQRGEKQLQAQPTERTALEPTDPPVPERVPSAAAMARARMRACGRVRVQLSGGRGGAGGCDRRIVRTRS